jgi:hypothetical protein
MKPVNFYEVQSRQGEVEWGGSSPVEATTWFRKGLDSKIFLSVWDEEDVEEPRLITDKLDITPIVMASIMSGRLGFGS